MIPVTVTTLSAATSGSMKRVFHNLDYIRIFGGDEYCKIFFPTVFHFEAYILSESGALCW